MKNVQDDTLYIKGDTRWGWYIKCRPTRKNRNGYPRKENNCGDYSSMVLVYDENLGDIIISRNTYLSVDIIIEIRDLVLSYLHIGLHTGDAKYSI